MNPSQERAVAKFNRMVESRNYHESKLTGPNSDFQAHELLIAMEQVIGEEKYNCSPNDVISIFLLLLEKSTVKEN